MVHTTFDRSRVPKHVAIIMDGNGRWAKARGLLRAQGHRKGVEMVREAVRNANEFGISYLTLFSFSSENWSRPETEVNDLLGLLKLFIRKDLAELHSQNVKVTVIGKRANLPKDIGPLIEEAEKLTRNNTALNLVIAFNYGSRDEITRAMQSIATKLANNEISANEIDPDMISGELDTKNIPDPDLIIRTSGEMRLSNFLMWQAAYAEFVFADCHWPDFDKEQFAQAIAEFQGRDRRFGALSKDTAS